MIGGYLINREFTDGTLKNILVVPVSFPKLLAGKLAAVGVLVVILGMYSFVITIIAGVCVGLPSVDAFVVTKGMFDKIRISICIYIAVLPIIAFCGRIPGFFMGGSMIAFVLGYCSMFFKSGLLRNIYPFLAPFTVIGFDTTSYISDKSKASFPLGIASFGVMLLISIFIAAGAKAPDDELLICRVPCGDYFACPGYFSGIFDEVLL